MEKIYIMLLGTGGAIPTITRNHTSIFLKYKNMNMLVDCGEGTQRQLRKAKINAQKITDILITHFHGDHIFGLPGLLHTLSKGDYRKTLNIYGPKGFKKLIQDLLKISNIRNIKVNIKEVSGKFIDNPYFKISALSLNHGIPCNGYMFEEKDRLKIDKKKLKKFKILNVPQLGKLINKKNIKIKGKEFKWRDLTYLEKGRKISFILDTELCNNARKLARNSDLAIIESSFMDKDGGKSLAKKYRHLTLEQAAGMAKKEKVKQLVLTHFSQRYEYKEKALLKQAKKIFKNSRIAKDLMSLEI